MNDRLIDLLSSTKEECDRYRKALEVISVTFMDLDLTSIDEMMAWGIKRGDIARKALKKE